MLFKNSRRENSCFFLSPCGSFVEDKLFIEQSEFPFTPERGINGHSVIFGYKIDSSEPIL
jgi:hypothetical protein